MAVTTAPRCRQKHVVTRAVPDIGAGWAPIRPAGARDQAPQAPKADAIIAAAAEIATVNDDQSTFQTGTSTSANTSAGDCVRAGSRCISVNANSRPTWHLPGHPHRCAATEAAVIIPTLQQLHVAAKDDWHTVVAGMNASDETPFPVALGQEFSGPPDQAGIERSARAGRAGAPQWVPAQRFPDFGVRARCWSRRPVCQVRTAANNSFSCHDGVRVRTIASLTKDRQRRWIGSGPLAESTSVCSRGARYRER